MRIKIMKFIWIVLLALVVLPQTVLADSRHFGYSYEADGVLEKGKWEFEQWLTFRGHRAGGNFYAFDLREEIETGLTDRLTTAVYLNFRETRNAGAQSFKFRGLSSEWKYMVSSPNLHPIGLLLYGELGYQGEEFEAEEKIILQHNFGDKWILALNLIAEHEWEFETSGTITELALEQTLGLAYKLSPNWSVGIEGRVHSEFVEYEDYEHSVLFIGPNLHYEKGKGWGTLTVLPQIVDIKNGGRNLVEHEAIEVRLLAGVYF